MLWIEEIQVLMVFLECLQHHFTSVLIFLSDIQQINAMSYFHTDWAFGCFNLYMSQMDWLFLFGNSENFSVIVCCAGSRGTDENNEDYLSKEVRSNNFLNFASMRKRVPKVTPAVFMTDWFIYLSKSIYMVSASKSALAPCAYTIRMKRNQKAWTLFIRESGNFTWRRFVDDIITCCLLPLKMLERIIMVFCLSSGNQLVK